LGDPAGALGIVEKGLMMLLIGQFAATMIKANGLAVGRWALTKEQAGAMTGPA
jgi:hypothetical protein